MFINEILPSLPKDRYKFIAIDSIASFDDPSKINRSDMGKKSQQIHRFFRKLLPLVDRKTILTFASHRTFKIGVLFGSNETVTGGEGVKFYTSYRTYPNFFLPHFCKHLRTDLLKPFPFEGKIRLNRRLT